MIWLLLIAFALVITYELWAVYSHELTITQHTWRLSAKYPVLPLGVGMLIGHLFL